MSSLLETLAPLLGYLIAGVGALVGVASVYYKGRADATAAAHLKDLERASKIRRVVDDANQTFDSDTDHADRLRRGEF